MSILCIHLLGRPSLAWEETPLPTIPAVSAHSLLAHLLTLRDRPHTCDFLTSTFWPDRPEAVARCPLSRAPCQIRCALSLHPALLTEGDLVQFRPDEQSLTTLLNLEGAAALECRER